MPTENSTKQTQLQWLIEAIRRPSRSACILWPFNMVDDDHALVRVEGKKVLAHRLAYKLHYGHYPEPQGIHSCQNLRCINPLHVTEGDKWANGKIRAAKKNCLYEWTHQQVLTRKDIDVCWLWPYSRTKQTGYGAVTIPVYVGGRPQRLVLAHRLTFFFLHGRWPKDDALHTCDNPPCFNPHHVVDGTHTENMRDMMAKGRHRYPQGEKCPFHKLNDDTVREMRRLFDEEEATTHELAAQFEVSISCVKGIVHRRSWKHVA